MALDIARRAIDFAFRTTPLCERIEIGLFGGEPLLELPLIREIAGLIEGHPEFDPDRVHLSLVSNGTIFDRDISEFIRVHDINFVISCDGPAEVHDANRRFRDGGGSSGIVESTIRAAVEALGRTSVNAVYGPATIQELPGTVDYLFDLGVRQVHLNADISAAWCEADLERVEPAYRAIGQRYVDHHASGDPRFINLIDVKVAVILRGGYRPLERCRMGRGEFAITPDGSVYPCERLVGNGGERHKIGHVDSGVSQAGGWSCRGTAGDPLTRACAACSLRDYCMNWCGCTNYFATGAFDSPGAFMCASERAALTVAHEVIVRLEQEFGATFFDHVSGSPTANSAGIRNGSEGRCLPVATRDSSHDRRSSATTQGGAS